MKRFISRIFLASIFLALLAGGTAAQTSQPKPPLTNASVVKLVRAGFKEKTIISLIAASPANFDLAPDQMIELKHNGVSEKIILEMVNRQQGFMLGDDNWSGDPFFDQGNNNQKDNQKAGGASTDIFGSSGSGRSETRSRGGNSSSSGDIETTGSATVRIIRPPTEAGGAPKLEKTSSLTNDSIVELIEAGFSEGTIIRRIERSPVEFDLSPAKVADLHRHRVSDKIVAAMRLAMGDDSNASKTNSSSNGTAKPE